MKKKMIVVVNICLLLTLVFAGGCRKSYSEKRAEEEAEKKALVEEENEKEAKGRANSNRTIKRLLDDEDTPHEIGEIVFLKPDGRRAVITEAVCKFAKYHVRYDCTGYNYEVLYLVNKRHLQYEVRYVVNRDNTKSDKLTDDEIIEASDYNTRWVNWREVDKHPDSKIKIFIN